MVLNVCVGFAIVEYFMVSCTGWTNCYEIENERLTYSYYVASKNESRSLLPIYKGRNDTVHLLFPVGDKHDYYFNQLTVVVNNDADYTAELRVYPITVRQFIVIGDAQRSLNVKYSSTSSEKYS